MLLNPNIFLCSQADVAAGCPTTRRSTSGYCVFLGNNLLSCSSKRQLTLSRSSAEAEYRGVANVVAETCWIWNLLRELHTPLYSATIVYCDNARHVDPNTKMVVIWNPTVRKSVGIDILVPKGMYIKEEWIVVGFGVCPDTSDLKLVMIIDDKISSMWVVESEKFGEMCLPERLVHTPDLNVTKVNESLSLLEYYDKGDMKVCGVWSRKDDANNQFTKIYTIKGLHMSKEETEEWNEDVYGYYKLKLQELVRKTNVKDLKLMIPNLDMQIIHSNKMVAIESRNKANSMCKSVMAEQETWSDEKLKFYKYSIGKEAFEKIVNQIKKDYGEEMHEDVAENLSGTAQFMASNVVTIRVDVDLNQMQGGLGSTIRQNEVKNFISNNGVSLCGIIETQALINNKPWVTLGDFNIILKINENSNGVNVRCEGMKEFVECIEDLEMEDINMCGMFYTWIQRMRNPKLGILKKLVRVMGNSKFISYFPTSFANFMPYLSSDHCPVILDMLDVAMFRPKYFRFMNFLADKSKFKEVVKIIGILMLKGQDVCAAVKEFFTSGKMLGELNATLISLIRKGDDTAFLLLYVDDIVLTASSDLTCDSSGMFLSQRKPDITYAVDSLQCLTFTRPDITYAVQQAGCPTTQGSTSGYFVFLGNNLLSCSSNRQLTLSHSSTDAEYRGVANVVAETCWIRNLLRELHTLLYSATIVYCDNSEKFGEVCLPERLVHTPESEKFGEVCLPERLVHTPDLNVTKVNESLSLLDYYDKGDMKVCGVWSRKDDANNQFTKIYTIKVEGKWLFNWVLGFRSNGEVVMELDDDNYKDSRIAIYEPLSGHINDVGINGDLCRLYAWSYIETLLLLDEADSIIL
nr:ribonuclease H-like domain-containing protein [Tanacetum cinerariifolium]